MIERVFCLQNEGHTLASIVCHKLFTNGADFAACVVPHPQSSYLNVHVSADNAHEVLLRSLKDAEDELQQLLDSLAGFTEQ